MEPTLTDILVIRDSGGEEISPALMVAYHQVADHVGQYALVPSTDRLVVGRGGTEFGPGVLEDLRLSREHFSVRRGRGGLDAADLESRNGIRVKDHQVVRKLLTSGDVLEAGGLAFIPITLRAGWSAQNRPDVVGHSLALEDVIRDVDAVAPRATTALVMGETGVGKEVIAREIHRRSGRKGDFVAVNCGGVAESILQSELFGHAKGSFTGATGQRAGLVERAVGGTLFLDEIGDATPALQSALLRLLQEREYRPVGSDDVIKTDVRFVAATHKRLKEDVVTGLFRRDLWARLSRWIVHIPPLRERRADIPLLVRHFLQRYGGPGRWLSRDLMLRLIGGEWPGNVRELDGVIERLCVRSRDTILEVPDWLDDVVQPAEEEEISETLSVSIDRKNKSRRPKKRPDKAGLEQKFLDVGGRMTELAKELKIGRKTAYRWMEEAGIDLDLLRDRLD